MVCEHMAPPATSITHSPSVTGRRVQVIHHNRISQEAFKHCKGSTRQEDCDKSKHLGVQLLAVYTAEKKSQQGRDEA